jgi:hypothetical protein
MFCFSPESRIEISVDFRIDQLNSRYRDLRFARVWLDLPDWGRTVGLECVALLTRPVKLVAQPSKRRRPVDQGQRLESAIAPYLLPRLRPTRNGWWTSFVNTPSAI